jgi:glycosyltransferase involved in cell wall biosynthesis
MFKSSKMPEILLLEACNFTNAPLGGQLTGARMLMRALGNRLALVGWTDDPTAPLGRWHERIIDGVSYRFFATACVVTSKGRKPIIPARLASWLQFKRYGKDILSIGIPNIMTQEPTVMMALPFTKRDNVCFWFPGIEPALSVSRYWWAKHLAGTFDNLLMKKLRLHCKTILAAADKDAVLQLRQRANGRLDQQCIHFFPTRVDTHVFYPGDRVAARRLLGLPANELLVVTSGRLHRAKGWPLLLDAIEVFIDRYPKARLFFVGDGNDREIIEAQIAMRGLHERVFIAGYQPPPQLALFLQAANLFVMGSEKEGWSTSLVEALACGLPIVTTRFSSADSIVRDGVNGFVVERDPIVFADAMEKALNLIGIREFSDHEVAKYSLDHLEGALNSVWCMLNVHKNSYIL